MNRLALTKKLRKAAKAKGLTFEVTGGGEHDKVVIGAASYPLPRHKDINENTAVGIFRFFEPELGENWWRQ